MTINSSPPTAAIQFAKSRSALNKKARAGTAWIVIAFGSGQVLRLGINIALAAILFEEAFALMALVTAVMVGLAMFSDIGLQQNVIHNSRGDDPDFLNTAWTIQVIRGLGLALIATISAWPLAMFYGTNDPAALELRWLIPLAALTALFDGLKSPRVLTAARHMHVAELTRIEIGVTIVNSIVLLVLAWYMRSVYALGISAVFSAALHAALTYWMLPGPRARFTLELSAVRSIVSFGKWIFLSTVLGFLALQIDRLAFGAMYPLAEVGVYSIAASLAFMARAVVGKLQSSVVFPWYARVLEDGMTLPEAFRKAMTPMLVASTYIVVLLVVGAESFFALAYDARYSQGAVFLQILAIGAWFSSVESMYGSAFLVKGLAKWVALVTSVKVFSFLVLIVLLSTFESTFIMAVAGVLASEFVMAVVSRCLGWRLGLKGMGVEAAMLVMVVLSAGLYLLLAREFQPLASLHPALRLMWLGTLVTALFAPLFFWILYPFLKRRSS